jgi:hypothetical protein
MRVEVLYVADCPTRAQAVEMLEGVLTEAGMPAEIQQVLVRDETMARQLRFRGSPTIRIDGRDIEGTPEGAVTFAVSCRLYRGSPQAGVPPLAMIQRAVREAGRRQAEP